MTRGRRLRVGIIGLDHYHVTGWAETLALFPAELEIVALYDPDPEAGRRLAPRHHDPALPATLPAAYRSLPVETDLPAMITRHDLDLALITMSNRDATAAIELLGRAGIHMLVDKPAAISAGAARRACAAARRGGARIAAGFTRRYSPAARAARQHVAGGRLGRVVAAQASLATSAVAVRDPANSLFSAELSGGGVLSWLGVHDLDTLPWLIGEPVTEVAAMIATTADAPIDVEDVSSVSLRFAGGAIATLHHGYVLPARGYRAQVAVHCTGGSLELALGEELVLVTAGTDGFVQEQTTRFEVPDLGGYGAAGHAAVADLLAAINEERDPVASGDDLVRALELIDAAYASARTGCVVALAGAP